VSVWSETQSQRNQSVLAAAPRGTLKRFPGATKRQNDKNYLKVGCLHPVALDGNPEPDKNDVESILVLKPKFNDEFRI
jgi:hypothetical protein